VTINQKCQEVPNYEERNHLSCWPYQKFTTYNSCNSFFCDACPCRKDNYKKWID